MARFSLIPRDEKFFDEFNGLAEEIQKGSQMLCRMLMGSTADLSQVSAIKDIEHTCDRVTHQIIGHLNSTFVTPLDREDIHALASRLDDVMDAVDAAASVMKLYKVDAVRPGARRLAEIIADSTDHITRAFAALEKRTGVLELAARVKQLEHEADRVHQDAIVDLFDQEKDPIKVIKWKEILDFLEAATDRCEDVSNLLEGIVVKHG
jgi:predicted phosphate transport protein (TIGR00153 family)